jgi:Ca2+-binding EF-hand superfamily protein
LGANITKREGEFLLEALDTNQDGVVDFNEFLIAIRGSPNAKRQAVIDSAFAKFDLSGDGVITSADLMTVFDCSKHPKVVSGDVTQEEVFVEFLSCFGDKNKDGTITRAEWNDYYAAVSASVDNDEHFCELMRAAWKL